MYNLNTYTWKRAVMHADILYSQSYGPNHHKELSWYNTDYTITQLCAVINGRIIHQPTRDDRPSTLILTLVKDRKYRPVYIPKTMSTFYAIYRHLEG